MPTAEQHEIDLLRTRISRLEAQLDFVYKHFGLTFVENAQPGDDPRVIDALRKNNLIEAIKIYREEFGVGLQEAKDAVDRMEASLPRDPAAAGQAHSYEPAIGKDPFEGDDGRLSLRVVLVVAALVGLCGLAIWILLMNV